MRHTSSIILLEVQLCPPLSVTRQPSAGAVSYAGMPPEEMYGMQVEPGQRSRRASSTRPPPSAVEGASPTVQEPVKKKSKVVVDLSNH